MVRKALALLVVAAIVGITLGAVGLLWPAIAGAQATPSASRFFSAPSVVPDGELEVTVTVGGYGSGGRVEETLPAGFSYVDGSTIPADIRVTLDGQTVRFTMRGTDEFSYKVTASGTEGEYTFNGVLKDEDRNSYAVDGDSLIPVRTAAVTPDPAPEPSADRSFSASSVVPGGELEVTVTVGGYGDGGRVEETLPAGFSYVDGSTIPADIRVTLDGQTVRFTMRGTDEFTYKVTASGTEGEYTFNGVLKDEDRNSYAVDGDSLIPVRTAAVTPDPAPEPSADRSFSASSVVPGGELEVTVTVGGYGDGGRVEETLPAGFSYVDGSTIPADIRVTLDGQTVRFTMRGTDEFTYKVTASGTEGEYTFNGVLKDEDRNSYPVEGDSQITVGPNASRSFSVRSVARRGQLEVTVTVGGYGDGGRVEETLPAGFSYVDGSATPADIRVTLDGQTVRFTMRGTTEITYKVTASGTPGSYTFNGVLKDEDRVSYPVGGDSSVTVRAPAVATPTTPPTPAPTTPPRRRSRGGGGGGGGGGIAAPPAGTVAAGATVRSPAPSETIPAQANVKTPNAGVVRITVAPEQATRVLEGFNAAGTVFDITAPPASAEEPLELLFLVRTQAAAADLIVLKDGVAVGDCRAASGQASPDPCVASRGKAGATVVTKVLTSDASSIWEFRSATPSATPTPAPTMVAPTPEPTVAPTMTPTSEPTVAPTLTPTPKPTVASAMRPTPRPTVAAVVLPTPRPTAAPTAVPPRVPTAPMAAAPTAMPTPEPTTAPVAPEPLPTAMPEPTVTTAPVAPPAVEEDGGFPVWLIVLIIVGAGAVLVGGFVILRARGR